MAPIPFPDNGRTLQDGSFLLFCRQDSHASVTAERKQNGKHMFRTTYTVLIAIAFILISIMGCSGAKNLAKTLPPTITTVKPAAGLTKKIAIVPTHSPDDAKVREVGALYQRALTEAMHDKDKGLELVTAQDEAFPQFLSDLAAGLPGSLNPVQLAINGRKAGYHGVMTSAVRNIRAYTKKTGLFWFRKERHFISLSVTLDLYDPFTAAKIVAAVEELTIKVTPSEYDAYITDDSMHIESLNDTVADVAQDLAKRVSKTLHRLPWQSSIIDIRSDRLILPAGLRAGLKRGDRLVVFEGRRLLDGQAGERFAVPGKRIGEVHIIAISDQMAEAGGPDAGSVRIGDMVVPVN
jgi:hypothetical protein